MTTIEFEWEISYDEHPTQLFVRVNGGSWISAFYHFDTEDEETIRNIILNDPTRWS